MFCLALIVGKVAAAIGLLRFTKNKLRRPVATCHFRKSCAIQKKMGRGWGGGPCSLSLLNGGILVSVNNRAHIGPGRRKGVLQEETRLH
jgi:hypothetical protein